MIVPTQQTTAVTATVPFQSASLYVGDLHNEVTEVFNLLHHMSILL
jgi:hypothetical protein